MPLRITEEHLNFAYSNNAMRKLLGSELICLVNRFFHSRKCLIIPININKINSHQNQTKKAAPEGAALL